jgi:hypothetical protein
MPESGMPFCWYQELRQSGTSVSKPGPGRERLRLTVPQAPEEQTDELRHLLDGGMAQSHTLRRASRL